MKNIAKILLCSLFILSINACVTIGNKFETANIPKIDIGKTTITDLENVLGEPYRRGIEDGYPTSTYLYYKLNLFGGKYTRDLYVKFDSNGVVKSYNYNTNFPDEEIQPASK